MAGEPIAIVGSACRFPGDSSSPSRLWDLLKNPRVVASRPPSSRFDIDAFYHEDPTYPGTTHTNEGYFLTEDPRLFDAPFFSISSAEAGSMDPQQRQLLEVAFESIEAAGLRIDNLRGSATGVFCGVMGGDWADLYPTDYKAIPRHAATGGARSCIANRISYFFDWHGPSVAVDTACSSSLVALHQAVTALQQEECSVALTAGTNLILTPYMFVTTSKMTMVSPRGRSSMWDAKADGYARGEGIACITLKRLRDAVADCDPIECVIRATGVNQDGRTTGLTMPSSIAQLQLIEATYRRAGLDPRNPQDRCQYFEAHGTGTLAGDPQEATAIHEAFFGSPTVPSKATNDTEKEADVLYVGSVKTVVGHTEGVAGLAGIIKASQCIQNGAIAPNLLFEKLNPGLEPFTTHLQVPTDMVPWPPLQPGAPRRVSVNSFGFGGTNAHAILESYEPPRLTNGVGAHPSLAVIPFTFSAAAERSFPDVLRGYVRYLEENQSVDLTDLATTLMKRRSALRYRLPVCASSVDDLLHKLRATADVPTEDLSKRLISQRGRDPSKHKILAVFTGQGAQWAQMGKDVISQSPQAQEWLQEMQNSLDQLPSKYSPTFSLGEELSNPDANLDNAGLSQPLCTALQVILVRFLTTLGISFTAIVGHSSGEIAAAYAAGFLTATDAIRVAYLRGLVASQTGAKGHQSGAMMAVGISAEEAVALCNEEEFRGRVTMAASNAPASVTLSGDSDAIHTLEQRMRNEKRFARLLRVNTAYHSHHMEACSSAYEEALRECNIQIQSPTDARWFSSVYPGVCIGLDDHQSSLTGTYWIENMVKPVLFAGSVQDAVAEIGEPDLVVEIGPHPALKGPARQVLTEALPNGGDIPYIGVSNRGGDGVVALASAIGDIWGYLGPDAVDISGYVRLFDPSRRPKLVKDLPRYPFNHDKTHAVPRRLLNQHLHHRGVPNPLLGGLEPTNGDGEWRWHHYLRQQDLPWLNGHRVQLQTIFPATGYVAMAVEAAGIMAANQQFQLRLLQIQDLIIHQAIVLPDEDPTGVETLFHLNEIRPDKKGSDSTAATFQIHASNGEAFQLRASGRLTMTRGEPEINTLASEKPVAPGMVPVDIEEFYTYLTTLGYGYTGHFRGISSLSRQKDASCGEILYDPSLSNLLLHPAVLDTALQVMLAALGVSDDGELNTLLVPIRIGSVTINPAFCGTSGVEGAGNRLRSAAIPIQFDADGISGDVDLFTQGGQGMVQIAGVEVAALVQPEDQRIFGELTWGLAEPDVNWLSSPKAAPEASRLAEQAERIVLSFMKFASEQLSEADREGLDWHRKTVVAWIDRALSMTREGTHPICRKEWLEVTPEDLNHLLQQNVGLAEAEIAQVVFDNLIPWIRREKSLLEALRENDLLTRFYKEDTQMKEMNEILGEFAGQITYRYPRMKILEIGAGTGSATRAIINKIERAYHSYTFTDISLGFFEDAKTDLVAHEDRFIYEVLDIEKDPIEQGFEEHAYDMIVASNVLHATKFMQATMIRVRRLLKPGGYLMVQEATNPDLLCTGFVVCGFEGWWAGHEDGRVWGPSLTVSSWDKLLRRTGFSGVDTYRPSADNPTFSNYSVIISQAVDENIQLLRNPMACTERSPTDLIIVGGVTYGTSQLVRQVKNLLESRFARIIHARTLESLETEKLSQIDATVLSLADVGWPWFQNLTEESLRSMQALVGAAGRMLWVTIGPEEESPYVAMSKGWLRSLALENKRCFYQYLNFAERNAIDVPLLASTLMRLVYTSSANDYKLSTQVHTTECELLVKGGVVQICRLRCDPVATDRHIAARRHLHRVVDPSRSTIRLAPAPRGHHDLRLIEVQQTAGDEATPIQVRVAYSTAEALPVGNGTFVHLVVGEDDESKGRVIAFSDQHASVVRVPSSWAYTVPSDIPRDQEAALLQATADIIVAEFLVQAAEPDSTVLVHGASHAFRRVVRELAQQNDIRSHFTTTIEGPLQDNTTILSAGTSTRALVSDIPIDVSVVACLGVKPYDEELFSRISRALPEDTRRQTVMSLYRALPQLPRKARPVDLHTHLEDWAVRACARVTQYVEDEASMRILNLEDFCAEAVSPGCLIDWGRCTSVSARVEAVNSLVSLSGHKTYLLAGLAGDLGQSIVKWMVSRGARYVILASRNPKVDPQWIAGMARLGARVVPMAMDLTNRASVVNVYRAIQREYPPLGGVANGALVLEDCEFQKMSLEILQKNIGPKVQGSLYLDELCGPNVDLDFFILIGSMMSVAGNWSQTAYSAATCFQASLIHQRRARGLVGSVIQLGLVTGVGIIARRGAGHIQYIQQTVGSQALSERGVDKFFAEAILAGHPKSGRSPEIMNRFSKVDPEEGELDWFRKPLLWEMIAYHTKFEVTQPGNAQGTLPTKARLKTATTMQEVLAMIEMSLLTKIRSKFSLGSDFNLTPSTQLLDLGMDSLVAVDMRNWFNNDVGVEVPILQFLSGGTVRDIVAETASTLPQSSIPKVVQSR